MQTKQSPSREIDAPFLDNVDTNTVSLCQSLKCWQLWKIIIYGCTVAFAWQM